MAKKLSKRFRWPTALAEAALLQALLASVAQSADLASQPAGGAAGKAAPVDAGPLSLVDANSKFFADARGDSGGSLVGEPGGELYLDVVLNTEAKGLAHFGSRDGELWASAATLRQLGFVLPTDAKDSVRLGSLQGVKAVYDRSRQLITINAPLSSLNLPTTVLNAPGIAAQRANASPGLLLNYDLYGTHGQGGASSLNAFTELRAFGGSVVLNNTSLSLATRSNSGDWQARSVRLDTTWSKSFADDMLTLRLGDTTTSSLNWSRATRIGGIQLSRNFALQPYLTTTPLPAFMGSATLPSEVELYVNGMRQYSGQVPAGPFQLSAIPNISGAGNARVVLTDAFGRATTLNFSLYGTRQLLRSGLADWSVELGIVREHYGFSSFDYGGDPTGSGTWRYGVSDAFTLEAHAEAAPGLATLGVGGAALLGGQAGVLSGAAENSNRNGLRGSQFNLGYSWSNSRFNVGLDSTATRGDYFDVASLYGSPPPRGTGRAQVGYSTDNFGSFGLSYLYLRYPVQIATRFASAYWFKSLGRSTSLTLSANQNLGDRSQGSVFLGLSWALDSNISMSAAVLHDSGQTTYTLDAQRSTPSDGGFGWRAGVSQGGVQNGGQAELDYLGRYGRVTAGVNNFSNNRNAYADATGAVVLMGGHAFVARPINDAFALVSTDGVAGVPVTLENRPIGTTDGNGMLLVTSLNAYQNNQLSIDPMQLPADVRIDRVKTIATPSDRAGTLVRFGITPIRAASVVLVDVAGEPLPVGSMVRVNTQTREPVMVGFDGVAYLDTLEKRNLLRVQTPSGICSASFDYSEDGKGIPLIGPVRCLKETQT